MSICGGPRRRARRFEMTQFWFLLGCCFLLVHEMDAVRCHEWRMHPFFSWIEEAKAYWAFTLVDVPLYLLLFWAVIDSGDSGQNLRVVFCLNAFFVVHAALHVGFLWHPQNEFRSAGSWILILGAGLCGAIALGT
jgi:hypothetical protein